VSWAASRAWYSESSSIPLFNSSTPSFFFLTPALKAGSKSFASFTLEPGSTRNGSMKRAIRFSISDIENLLPVIRARREHAPHQRKNSASTHSRTGGADSIRSYTPPMRMRVTTEPSRSEDDHRRDIPGSDQTRPWSGKRPADRLVE
jgi:hypothetical protein